MEEEKIEIEEWKEKTRDKLAKKLEKSDPEKWIIRIEKQPHERGRGFFTETLKLLGLPRNSDGVICLGKIADMEIRRIYILGKDPAVTGIIVGILRESLVILGDRPVGSRVGKDRRHYVDIAGLNEEDEQKIEEIIKSGLIELRSFHSSVRE